MFGTGNTENQYIDYDWEQGIKRFIYKEQGRRNWTRTPPPNITLRGPL